jgi:hypothetical protein
LFRSGRWFSKHPDDTGGVVHEYTHAIMRAPTYDETTSWLIEGLAVSAELVARPLDQSLDRAGVVLL